MNKGRKHKTSDLSIRLHSQVYRLDRIRPQHKWILLKQMRTKRPLELMQATTELKLFQLTSLISHKHLKLKEPRSSAVEISEEVTLNP